MQRKWRQKIPKQLFEPFKLCLQKKVETENLGLTNVHNFASEFRNLSKMKEKSFFSTGETKAATVECDKLPTKINSYQLREDYKDKNILEKFQFFTTLNLRPNGLKDLIAKNVKKFNNLSIFYSKQPQEFIKNSTVKMEKEFATPKSPFRNNSSVHKIFLILLKLFLVNRQRIQKQRTRKNFTWQFYQ